MNTPHHHTTKLADRTYMWHSCGNTTPGNRLKQGKIPDQTMRIILGTHHLGQVVLARLDKREQIHIDTKLAKKKLALRSTWALYALQP